MYSFEFQVAHRRQQAASSKFKRSGAAGSRFKCAEAREILILRRNLGVTEKREIEQILKIERMQLEGE